MRRDLRGLRRARLRCEGRMRCDIAPTSVRSGKAAVQVAISNLQRGAKLQPRGRFRRSGGLPGMASIWISRDWPCTVEDSRPSVYGCSRTPQHVGNAAIFDDPSGVHHRHLVGDLGRDAKIVGDEDHPHAELALQARAASPEPGSAPLHPARWSARPPGAATGGTIAPTRSWRAGGGRLTIRAHRRAGDVPAMEP